MSSPSEVLGCSAKDFPHGGSLREKFRTLAGYAQLAPSEMNVQPWRFIQRDLRLDLEADPGRILPKLDPERRGTYISCGSALLHLRVALRHFGFEDGVVLFPDEQAPQVLASVGLLAAEPWTPTDDLLFAAITQRRTNRGSLREQRLHPSVMTALSEAARTEGGTLHFIEDQEMRTRLAAMVTEVDINRWADPDFRAEYSSCLREPADNRRDGVAAGTSDVGSLAVYLGSHMVRHTDLGCYVASKHRETLLSAPEIVVLTTESDGRPDWIMAGQALARVLLVAHTYGVSASFFNQPISDPLMRADIGAMLPFNSWPQIILRLGYGTRLSPAIRRPIDDVLR